MKTFIKAVKSFFSLFDLIPMIKYKKLMNEHNYLKAKLNWLAADVLANAKLHGLINNSDIQLADKLIKNCNEYTRNPEFLIELVSEERNSVYRHMPSKDWYVFIIKDILLENIETTYDPAI